MSAFAVSTDVVFSDPNHGLDALYRSGGAGPGVPARVLMRAPDGIASFGERRFVMDTVIMKVRVREVAEPVAGDTFEVAGEVFTVQGAPTRDPLRLVWTCEVRTG